MNLAEKKTRHVFFRVGPTDYSRIHNYAKQRKVKTSTVLREIVLKHIAASESQPTQ